MHTDCLLQSPEADERLGFIPLQACEAPPQPVDFGAVAPLDFCYEATVQKREGRGLGVDLSPHDGVTLLIGRMKLGPLEDWNATRPPGALDLIQRGDRIVAVNGNSGKASSLLERMRADETLAFTLRRLLQFSLTLQRPAAEGFGLSVISAGSCLRICRVLLGVVQDLNKTNGAELELRRGDEIWEANGVSGTAAALWSVLKHATEVWVKIRRPRSPMHWSDDQQADPGESLLI